jgi:hypothetical protein
MRPSYPYINLLVETYKERFITTFIIIPKPDSGSSFFLIVIVMISPEAHQPSDLMGTVSFYPLVK